MEESLVHLVEWGIPESIRVWEGRENWWFGVSGLHWW